MCRGSPIDGCTSAVERLRRWPGFDELYLLLYRFELADERRDHVGHLIVM